MGGHRDWKYLCEKYMRWPRAPGVPADKLPANSPDRAAADSADDACANSMIDWAFGPRGAPLALASVVDIMPLMYRAVVCDGNLEHVALFVWRAAVVNPQIAAGGRIRSFWLCADNQVRVDALVLSKKQEQARRDATRVEPYNDTARLDDEGNFSVVETVYTRLPSGVTIPRTQTVREFTFERLWLTRRLRPVILRILRGYFDVGAAAVLEADGAVVSFDFGRADMETSTDDVDCTNLYAEADHSVPVHMLNELAKPGIDRVVGYTVDTDLLPMFMLEAAARGVQLEPGNVFWVHLTGSQARASERIRTNSPQKAIAVIDLGAALADNLREFGSAHMYCIAFVLCGTDYVSSDILGFLKTKTVRPRWVMAVCGAFHEELRRLHCLDTENADVMGAARDIVSRIAILDTHLRKRLEQLLPGAANAEERKHLNRAVLWPEARRCTQNAFDEALAHLGVGGYDPLAPVDPLVVARLYESAVDAPVERNLVALLLNIAYWAKGDAEACRHPGAVRW